MSTTDPKDSAAIDAAALQSRVRDLESQLAQTTKALQSEQLDSQLHRALASANLQLPADIAVPTLRASFRHDGKQFTALGAFGELLMSKTRNGEPASIAEAVPRLIESHPHLAAFVGKPSSATGTSSPTAHGGKEVVTRKAFDGMNPRQRADLMARVSKGAAALVD